MSLQDLYAIYSPDERHKLESGKLINYNSMTDDELKKEMRERGIRPHGRVKKADLVNALTASDRTTRKNYQHWKSLIELPSNPSPYELVKRSPRFKALMKDRRDLMFASAYREDPDRLTFLDLPGELRNSIYEYVLFGQDLGSHGQTFVINDATGKLWLSRGKSAQVKYQDEMSICTLIMFGAMNNQIRSEVRALFWAKCSFSLRIEDAPQHVALLHFLTNIGPGSRMSIPHLKSMTINSRNTSNAVDSSQAGYNSFQGLLQALATCVSLRSLNLVLAVSNVFRGDVGPLKDYFLSGRAMNSTGLELLASTLSMLPKLSDVSLDIIPLRPNSYISHPSFIPTRYNALDDASEHFLDFAFSGQREVRLWMEIKERLNANWVGQERDVHKLNSKTVVRLQLSDPTDYNMWQLYNFWMAQVRGH